MNDRENRRAKVNEILSKSRPIIFFLHYCMKYSWVNIGDICMMTTSQLIKLREYDGKNWVPYLSTCRHCYDRLYEHLRMSGNLKMYETWYKAWDIDKKGPYQDFVAKET